MPVVREADLAGSPRPLSYDYVIVGAGSAGSVVARRLLEGSESNILLIEAGDSGEGIESLVEPSRWVENMGAAHDWNYHYQPTPQVAGRAIPLSRGKLLGGSGETNGLVWFRGNRRDFDRWEAAGNAGWGYDSLLQYFRRSEAWEDGATFYRGGDGPIQVERARDLHPVASALIESGLSLGLPYLDDINRPEPEGAGPMNLNVAFGRRSSPWLGYVAPVLDDPRLTVLAGAQVVRLRVWGGRCRGVEARLGDQVVLVEAGTEVILCAGAIDTPRLLLLSGIGPAGDLHDLGVPVVHDLPGVGRNLQDHVILGGMCFAATAPMAPFRHNLEGSLILARSDAGLASADILFVAMQIAMATPEIAASYDIPANGFCIAPGLMEVKSRGYLRLTSLRDGGQLEIQPNMLAERADLEALVAAVEIGFELADQPGFRGLIERWKAPSAPLGRRETIEFIRKSALSYAHPAGTCAMGQGAEFVVDRDLRVHGLTGLRIADASIMPTIPAANTNAATVMIGEVAAARILASVSEARHAVSESV